MGKKKTVEDVIDFPDQYRVIGADLSLKRPGFCQLHIKKTNEGLSILDISTSSVDNKTKTKAHGLLLDEIQRHATAIFIRDKELKTFYVREQGFIGSKGAMAQMAKFKVVGIMDLLAQRCGQKWYQILPVTVKKYVTGNGKAQKQQVQKALSYYVGERQYNNDDQSDATAVAIAWLIKNNQIKQHDQNAERESE